VSDGKNECPAEGDRSRKREVSQETIAATTKCVRGHACLNGGGPPLCEVKQWLSNKYAFVKTKHSQQCPYCIPFGLVSSACSCPVRSSTARAASDPYLTAQLPEILTTKGAKYTKWELVSEDGCFTLSRLS